MTYREKSDTDLYGEHIRDIVLERHSALGPWLVMGLLTVLTLFLCYLIYSNVLRPTTVASSPERSLRMMNEGALTTTSTPDPSTSALVPPWTPVATSVPQSRATHALVGGEGPALLSADVSASPSTDRLARDMHER